MQGQRDLETVSQLIMSELSPTVRRPARRLLPRRPRRGRAATTSCSCSRATATRAQGRRATALPPGEGLVGQAALEKKPILHHRAARRLHPDRVRPRRRGAAQHHRDPGPLRGAGARGDRAGLVHAVQRDHPAVPRPAHRDDRRRALHDHRQHPHRGAARAVAVAVAGAAEQSEALQRQQEELQATNEELQEKAAQLERQNRDIEIKNREIEMARSSLEEKAEQLALSARSTSPSSWRTCRTSCARRSTRC